MLEKELRISRMNVERHFLTVDCRVAGLEITHNLLVINNNRSVFVVSIPGLFHFPNNSN